MKTFGLFFLCLALNITGASAQTLDKNLIGYFMSWSVYGRDYHVTDIPAEQITAINYAFANISNGQIALGDPYADIDKFYEGDSWDPDSLRGNFHQLQILKAQYPHIKTLISVGGWTWSEKFSDVALTPQSRTLFASSCVDFIQEYGFDGVDIDWEYPVCCGLPNNTYRPEDKENFTFLLTELRTQLDSAGDYLLTIATSASPMLMENIELDLLHLYVDGINIMSYDFHGPWGGESDPVTNFNSSLHAPSDDPLPEPYHSQFNFSAAIENYLAYGVPSDKLNAGLPFYGRGYAAVSNENNGLYASYSGASNGSWENGIFDYWDLQQNYIDQNGFSRYWHTEAQAPWLYNPTSQIMISYEDGEKFEAIRRMVLLR